MKYVNKLHVKLLAFLIIVVCFTLAIGNAEAGTNIIEFKKKYVTNSPKVCGDKLCDEELDTSISKRKNLHTPMGQYNSGIPIYQITCKPYLDFVLKVSNWHPACVKPENVQRLVDMGWAATIEEKNYVFEAITKKIPSSTLKPLEEYRKEYPLYEGFGLNITPDIIAGDSYLIFKGFGWRGYHNVEILISNSLGQSEFMMSQTDDRGELYLPWKIPDFFTSGLYHIRATDGVHEYDIDIPITVVEN
jgi:hypothetical protein